MAGASEEFPNFRRQSAAFREIYSVSRLNEAARLLLESELGTVWVEGEVSNLARPASGHVYFSLKDRTAQVRCALFRRRGAAPAGAVLRDGAQVVAYGRVSLYAARGDYQLIVETVEAAGEGLLRQRFEELKRRLDQEGLFDVARKRALPAWPRTIGVVTSATGAALHDILTVLARRCAAIPVILYPTAVQGDGAAAEIVAALATANRRAECDVLIVGRGGGSLEDLWSFNEEAVARAIHASTIPVVSAVGHEVDFTIADLVADVRAPTPSAAAELVSPDLPALAARFTTLEHRLVAVLGRALRDDTRRLVGLEQRLALLSPQRRLEQHAMRLDELAARLPQALGTRLALARERLAVLAARLSAAAPGAALATRRIQVDGLALRLERAAERGVHQRRDTLGRLAAVLHAVSPQATLERGYALVTDADGRLVRDSGGLVVGARVQARLARGSLEATVSAITPPPEAS